MIGWILKIRIGFLQPLRPRVELQPPIPDTQSMAYVYLHLVNFHGKCMGKYTDTLRAWEYTCIYIYNCIYYGPPKKAVNSSKIGWKGYVSAVLS